MQRPEYNWKRIPLVYSEFYGDRFYITTYRDENIPLNVLLNFKFNNMGIDSFSFTEIAYHEKSIWRSIFIDGQLYFYTTTD